MLALVKRAKYYDEQAVAKLCEHFYPKIYAFIYYRANSREDAADITGEVFIKMVEAIEKQNGFFQAWLFKIAKNLVVDYYRHREIRQEVPLTEDLVEQREGPEDQMANSIIQERMKKGINKLSDEQQQVIVLKFINGFSNGEISQIMSKSRESIRALQFRGLTKLRKILKEDIPK